MTDMTRTFTTRLLNLAITVRNRARKRWRRALQRLMVPLVLFPATRELLARIYLLLGPKWRVWFHDRFRLILYDLPNRPDSSRWSAKFGDATLQMPLRTETFALDWNQALALAGHDLEVKMIYAALLTPERRPAVFLDVGANFGTHSLLMVGNQVQTITFEPNPACHDHLRSLFAFNNLQPQLETVALGAAEGETTLWFPPGQTWHGSTDEGAKDRLEDGTAWISHPVAQRTLDSYLPGLPDGRVLLKLDTEGTEALVLSGATELLSRRRPLVIFESLRGSERTELWRLFSRFGLRLSGLRFHGSLSLSPLATEAQFIGSEDENFLAVSDDGPWPPVLTDLVGRPHM